MLIISAEIGKIGGVKADVSERIANSDTTGDTISITAIEEDTDGMPTGTSVSTLGAITKYLN